MLMLLSGALVLSLGACTHAERSTTFQLPATGNYTDDIDWARVNVITEDALRKGYKIVWINPPQKPKEQRNKQR
jgi:hypothetical protein